MLMNPYESDRPICGEILIYLQICLKNFVEKNVSYTMVVSIFGYVDQLIGFDAFKFDEGILASE